MHTSLTSFWASLQETVAQAHPYTNWQCWQWLGCACKDVLNSKWLLNLAGFKINAPSHRSPCASTRKGCCHPYTLVFFLCQTRVTDPWGPATFPQHASNTQGTGLLCASSFFNGPMLVFLQRELVYWTHYTWHSSFLGAGTRKQGSSIAVRTLEQLLHHRRMPGEQ